MAAKLPEKDSTWRERRKKSYDHRLEKQVKKAPKECNLESYSDILAGLKWLACQIVDGKMKAMPASVLKSIFIAAGLNLKMKIQRAGDWIEKSERKHEVDVSDKLAACLLKVQGSTKEQLKEMKGEVNQIIGGLRE